MLGQDFGTTNAANSGPMELIAEEASEAGVFDGYFNAWWDPVPVPEDGTFDNYLNAWAKVENRGSGKDVNHRQNDPSLENRPSNPEDPNRRGVEEGPSPPTLVGRTVVPVPPSGKERSLAFEISLLSSLNHPHVLRVYGGCRIGQFLVMELCRCTVQNLMHESVSPLPLEEVLRVSV